MSYSLRNKISMLFVMLICGHAVMAISNDSKIYNGYCGSTENGADGKNISWEYNPSDNSLVLKGQGEMANWDYWNGMAPWYYDFSYSIKSVKISEGITTIGDWAFIECSSLNSVSIPKSVEYIGGGAFFDTQWYKNLPDGDVYIGKTYYEYKGDFESLTKKDIKAGTKYIANGAFHSCHNLKKVTLPEGIEYIGRGAFYNCISLEDITIPASVKYIGRRAFTNTVWFNDLDNGVIYINDILYAFKGKKVKKSAIDVRPGTRIIADYAFCMIDDEEYIVENTELKKVNIPEGVVSIGRSAFEGCSALNSVNVPNSVKKIGDFAFYGCTSLKIMAVNATVPPTIEANTFNGVDWNAQIVLPVKSIKQYQAAPYWNIFYNKLATGHCGIKGDGLDGNELTWELTADGKLVIKGNGEMANWSEDATPWQNYSKFIKSVTIAEGVTKIGNKAFANCNSILSFSFPKSLSEIGYDAFEGTKWLDKQKDEKIYVNGILYK